MKKTINDSLFFHLREFFTIFLPKQARRSPHTILATQQVWNMLLSFVCAETGKRIETLAFTDLSHEKVMSFLDKMQQMKGWTPSTRNHRLSRIRSFFRYVASVEPILVVHLENLRGIPFQKGVNKSFVLEYMSKEAIATILRQPDPSQRNGLRDLFFLVLMYDSAARDCEMLSLRFCDFDPVRKVVYLLGKGNKPRSVPISENTVQHFYRYAKAFHPEKDEFSPMFYIVRHGNKEQMSDDNVARFISKYGASAKAECSEIPERVYPHLIRKTRSMILYQAGMPLELLAQLLGHVDPAVTLRYAQANNEMKRKAIEGISAVTGSVNPEAEAATWDGNDEMIRRLLGLN
jgi:site-specific recombinase XerD